MARGCKPLPKTSAPFNVGPKPAASKAPRVIPGERHYEDYRMKTLAEFIKLKPPTFEGHPDPSAAEKWLKTVKKMFDATRVSPQFRVGFAIYLFEGPAEDWLDSKEDDHCNVASLNWNNFEKLFRETFVHNTTLKCETFTELCALGQRKMTVAQYFSRFAELSRHDPATSANPPMQCVTFTRGLRPDIRSMLSAYTFTDIDVLVDAAFRVEAAFGRADRARKPPYKGKAVAKKGQTKGGLYRLCTCNSCGGLGHKTLHCPARQSSSNCKRFKPSYSCDTCAQTCHKKSKYCPFTKLQARCDVWEQLRSQSGSVSVTNQIVQTDHTHQPEVFESQNTPPPVSPPPPERRENVTFTVPQTSAELVSDHQKLYCWG